MSHTVTVEEAASRFADLISSLHPGDEITVTSRDRAVAKITAAEAAPVRLRRAGAGKGKLHIIKEDDEHLEDFKEDMQ